MCFLYVRLVPQKDKFMNEATDQPVDSDVLVLESTVTENVAEEARPSKTPLDVASYVSAIESWNAISAQPWAVKTLVQSENKVFVIVSKKELKEDLWDWFEDTRLAAVMRGEKVPSPGEHWNRLYKQAITDIQAHFRPLQIWISEQAPIKKYQILWGQKPTSKDPVDKDSQQYNIGKQENSKVKSKKRQFARAST